MAAAENGLAGMALAAGLGKRIQALASDRPKPLIGVGGRTLLDHALDRLVECGVARVVVNVHHYADMMEAHLRMRTPPPVMVVSDERAQLLETGGGLVKALPLLGSAPVLVTNTDAIFLPDRADWTGWFSGFDPAREDARLLLVPKQRTTGLNGNGAFHLIPDGRISVPGKGEEAPYFYTGMQILNLEKLQGRLVEPFSMWRVWNAALAAGRLTGAVFAGDWLHVGDPEGFHAAEARLAASRPQAAAL